MIVRALIVNTSQTTGIDIWNGNERLNHIVIPASDVIYFHKYYGENGLVKQISHLKQYSRQIICFEWMNRTASSVILNSLPVLKD